MAQKESIKERRLNAIYNFKNSASSTQRKKLLEFLLATASHRIIKQATEELGIKVK